MTIFTPYMSADLYQRVPDWQRIERYDYCSQGLPRKTAGIWRRLFAWLWK
ncbi:hypothetical protein [Porcincola intestinalis]|nr:hypothetical protein [Porcincola intestinalis]MCI6238588.1 hypothetical protein [Lachnospiraceae bacterium]MCI6699600.1 hypothetical protein [Lachnospiraceae bacterium]MCI7094013.1 hypothetical protein [Lachnospiraceae bacterium]MDY4205397.1 hypothetical protein [Porcincola intestinalis]